MINPYSIVGLDLSLTGTGVASCGGTRTVKSNAKLLIEERVDRIWADIRTAIGEVALHPDQPSLYLIEGLAYASNTGKVAERAFLHHFVRWQLWRAGKRFSIVAPTARAKFATGKGNAGKDEVMIAITKMWPQFEATNNNEADAVCLYQMGMLHCMPSYQQLSDLPAVNKAALDKVEWNG